MQSILKVKESKSLILIQGNVPLHSTAAYQTARMASYDSSLFMTFDSRPFISLHLNHFLTGQRSVREGKLQHLHQRVISSLNLPDARALTLVQTLSVSVLPAWHDWYDLPPGTLKYHPMAILLGWEHSQVGCTSLLNTTFNTARAKDLGKSEGKGAAIVLSDDSEDDGLHNGSDEDSVQVKN